MEVNVLNCLLRKINSLYGHTYIEEICGQYFKLGFYLDGGGGLLIDLSINFNLCEF